ncbi:MAG: hypothetical protein AAF219_00650 [Myxococcota bacterium]
MSMSRIGAGPPTGLAPARPTVVEGAPSEEVVRPVPVEVDARQAPLHAPNRPFDPVPRAPQNLGVAFGGRSATQPNIRISLEARAVLDSMSVRITGRGIDAPMAEGDVPFGDDRLQSVDGRLDESGRVVLDCKLLRGSRVTEVRIEIDPNSRRIRVNGPGYSANERPIPRRLESLYVVSNGELRPNAPDVTIHRYRLSDSEEVAEWFDATTGVDLGETRSYLDARELGVRALTQADVFALDSRRVVEDTDRLQPFLRDAALSLEAARANEMVHVAWNLMVEASAERALGSTASVSRLNVHRVSLMRDNDFTDFRWDASYVQPDTNGQVAEFLSDAASVAVDSQDVLRIMQFAHSASQMSSYRFSAEFARFHLDRALLSRGVQPDVLAAFYEDLRTGRVEGVDIVERLNVTMNDLQQVQRAYLAVASNAVAHFDAALKLRFP